MSLPPSIVAIFFTLALVAAGLLLWFGARLRRAPANPVEQRRGLLMIVAALVLVGNVLIWLVPINR